MPPGNGLEACATGAPTAGCPWLIRLVRDSPGLHYFPQGWGWRRGWASRPPQYRSRAAASLGSASRD